MQQADPLPSPSYRGFRHGLLEDVKPTTQPCGLGDQRRDEGGRKSGIISPLMQCLPAHLSVMLSLSRTGAGLSFRVHFFASQTGRHLRARQSVASVSLESCFSWSDGSKAEVVSKHWACVVKQTVNSFQRSLVPSRRGIGPNLSLSQRSFCHRTGCVIPRRVNCPSKCLGNTDLFVERPPCKSKRNEGKSC